MGGQRKDILQRRHLVDKLRNQKKWTVEKIAKHVGVSEMTVYNDIQAINEKYKKLVAENPNFLKRQLDHVFRFVDEIDTLIGEYYKIIDSEELSPDEKRKFLDSIRKAASEKAQVLRIVGGDNKYMQQNFVHIEHVNQKITPLVNHVIYIINQFVPKEQRKDALTLLQNFDIKSGELTDDTK